MHIPIGINAFVIGQRLGRTQSAIALAQALLDGVLSNGDALIGSPNAPPVITDDTDPAKIRHGKTCPRCKGQRTYSGRPGRWFCLPCNRGWDPNQPPCLTLAPRPEAPPC